jgi:hypothetical protein
VNPGDCTLWESVSSKYGMQHREGERGDLTLSARGCSVVVGLVKVRGDVRAGVRLACEESNR